MNKEIFIALVCLHLAGPVARAALGYSNFLGGNGLDQVLGIAVDPVGLRIGSAISSTGLLYFTAE